MDGIITWDLGVKAFLQFFSEKKDK